MKPKRLQRSDRIWCGLAIACIVLQFWWLPGESRSSADSYSTTLEGKLALYRMLEPLFPRVIRNSETLIPASQSDTLVIVSPDRYPGSDEEEQLYQFVTGGGTLVFAPNISSPKCDLSSLGIHLSPLPYTASTSGNAIATGNGNGTTAVETDDGNSDEQSQPTMDAQTSSPPDTKKSPDTGADPSAQQPDNERATRRTPLDPLSELSMDHDDQEDSRGITGQALPSDEGLLADPDALPSDEPTLSQETASGTFTDESFEWRTTAEIDTRVRSGQETLVRTSRDEVVSWPLGQGRVVLCSSPDVFSNRSMMFPETRRIAVRLIEHGYQHSVDRHARDSATTSSQMPAVVVSEFLNVTMSYQNHGVLLTPSLRSGTLQIVLAAILCGWLGFHRFGPAIQDR
ncbi:MAG: DUF4350 domain-containing protein, partial [Planctomycetaceae bacterium]|nr:DUF4350 domain-containing protein [Planctomycetaceae bacterium]